MTRTVALTLPGTPTPKARPRFTRTGHTYTDARTLAAEQTILAAWLQQMGSAAPHTGPVSVEVIASFTVAASWPRWKRDRATSGHWPHLSRPDLDNLIKTLDALNGRAWADDSQITHITARKQYAETASLHVLIHLHPHPVKG